MSTSISSAWTVRAVWASAPALVICGSFATAGIALSTPVFAVDGGGYRSDTTIYPIWVWALVIAGCLAGLMSVGQRPTAVKSAAAGVALVAALPLAGMGVVGREHTKPSFGHGGYYGNGSVSELEAMAMLMAAAAVVGIAAAIAQLVLTGAFSARVDIWTKALSVFLGLAVIVAIPLMIKNGAYNAGTLKSWGMVGLMYAGPWGAAIIATAWLDRPAAVAVLASVCGCALLAVVGPHLAWLFSPDPTGPFAVALIAPTLAVAARFRPVGFRAVPNHS